MADSPYPRPGYWYTAVQGDFIIKMSRIAYGDDLHWSKIWGANTCRSGNPDLIYPGERFFIPGVEPVPQAVKAAENKYANEPQNSYKFLLDGMSVPVTSFRLQRSFDSIFDTWITEIPWIPGENIYLDRRVRRDSFTDSQMYLGPQLMATGRMYNVKNRLTTSGSSKVLECYTSTVDLVDSKMPPQFCREWAGCDLKTIAVDVLKKSGFSPIFDSSLGGSASLPSTGPDFDWVALEKVESYSAFLIRLASMRGILVANDEHGRVVFQKAVPNQKPVGTIDDTAIMGAMKAMSATGAQASADWSTTFSGRERFALYAVIPQGGDGLGDASVSRDPLVPSGRTMVYETEDVYTDPSSTTTAANWRKAKQLAKAWTIPIPVTSWYNQAGSLWTPGQIVTIKSKYLELPDGANFLVRQTEHILDEGGMRCQLMVCPPQCFTGEELPKEFA